MCNKKNRCENCEFMVTINAQEGWSFNGCVHKPYKGKYVSEIKDYPKQNNSVTA